MAKFVPISLDKPRRLMFDVNALSDAEDALGTSIGKAMTQRAGIREIRTLLWAAMKWEDRGLTVERAGNILQKYIEAGGSLEEIGTKIGEAIVASGLFKTEGADDPNGTAEAGT